MESSDWHTITASYLNELYGEIIRLKADKIALIAAAEALYEIVQQVT